MIISIDIDGVLCEIGHFTQYSTAKPIHANIAKVQEAFAHGHRIILNTSRYKADRATTSKWLKDNNVPWHELHLGKPQADMYIDDKNINLEDFLKWEP